MFFNRANLNFICRNFEGMNQHIARFGGFNYCIHIAISRSHIGVCKLFFVFLDLAMSGAIENVPGSNPAIFALIIPFHLFAMFCIFYCLYFVSKVFKTVELQRKVAFSDFAGEFFMIWFFIVGIWIIQPKINKMI